MRARAAGIVLLLAICAYFTGHSRDETCSPWRHRLAVRNRQQYDCLKRFVAGLRCGPGMLTFENELRRRDRSEIFPALYGPQAYYGDDNNVDPSHASLTEMQKRNVAATVAMIDVGYFDQQGDVFRLNNHALTLGQQGLCCGQHRRADIAVATCTGFLVAQDTVVTARHCVDDEEVARKIRYVFGFVKDSDGKLPPQFVKNVTLFEAFPPRVSCEDGRGADWAIVKLRREVPRDVRPVVMGLGIPKVGDEVYMVSSPLGVPLQFADHANVRNASQYGFFVTNLDGFTSSSGAPVFSRSSDKVEGIYVRGEVATQDVCGCTRAIECPDDGCRGEDVTRISLVPLRSAYPDCD